jgi:acetyl esterase/lipase
MRCMRIFGGALIASILISATLVSAEDPVVVRADVGYVSRGGQELALDVYMPSDRERGPAVLLVHGGSWRAGNKRDLESTARRLATDGFVAFAVEYRLLPPGGRATFRQQLSDLKRAIGWIRTNGHRFGADADRLGLVGASAGAHLALMVGTQGRNASNVDAVVSWSAPTAFARVGRGMVRDAIRDYVGCGLRTCRSRWKARSPITHVGAGDSPTLVVNGTDEIVHASQARSLVSKLRRSGVEAGLHLVQGNAHANEYYNVVWDRTSDFLQAHLT